MYYIMKSDAAYAACAHNVAKANTRREAERIARGLDTTLNGKPMGRTWVLSQIEFDDGHDTNVAPLYGLG